MSLWTILFGEPEKPKPKPETKKVSKGWTVRIDYTRRGKGGMYPYRFHTDLTQDVGEATKTKFRLQGFLKEVAAGSRNFVPLEQTTPEGKTYITRLTAADVHNSVSLEVVELFDIVEV